MRLIDADALIPEILHKLCVKSTDYLLEQERFVVKMIENAPTINTEPVRHGEWIRHIDNSPSIGMYVDWNCSKCNYTGRKGYKFCPNCGARMDDDNET